MLRCVFVGSPNRFTMLLVHWLSKHADLAGAVWTTSAHWALTLSGKAAFAKKRINRFGLLKAADEAIYYVLARRILNHSGEHFQSRLAQTYVRQYGVPDWQGASIKTDDINSPEVIQFIRDRAPDLIMSMCINEYFRREIREIPVWEHSYGTRELFPSIRVCIPRSGQCITGNRKCSVIRFCE